MLSAPPPSPPRPEIVPVYELMWNCDRARQIENADIIHRSKDAICVPDNLGKNMDTH